MRGIATAVLAFVSPFPSVASDRVLRAVLSEDAATVEVALGELWDTLFGSLDDRWSVDSVAFFREDVDLASWFGEVLATGRREARETASDVLGILIAYHPSAEMIEFAAENHRPATDIFRGWPRDMVNVPTMERLRSREDSVGPLARLSEDVSDDEARRLAHVFASQMRRIQAALPQLVEDEYDRRQRSGTIGSERDETTEGISRKLVGDKDEVEVLDGLLSVLAYLQEEVGSEETRASAWTTWMKEREAQGLPVKVVGVKAPWNLFGMGIAHELGESGFPLDGRALPPGLRRVALAITAEPYPGPGPVYRDPAGTLVIRDPGLEAAVALLANERPLAEETGKRILDLHCGSLDDGCFEKLNLLYAGPDDPSLRSIEADVGRRIVDSLTGLVHEVGRECGVLAKLEAEVLSAADARTTDTSSLSPEHWMRQRIWSIGEELQDVLALAGRMDSVPEPVLEGVFEFWSTERFPEARRILEDNDWLEPDVATATSDPSDKPDRLGAGLSPRRAIGPDELCRRR